MLSWQMVYLVQGIAKRLTKKHVWRYKKSGKGSGGQVIKNFECQTGFIFALRADREPLKFTEFRVGGGRMMTEEWVLCDMGRPVF